MKEQLKWIPANRKPTYNEQYLVITSNGEVEFAQYCGIWLTLDGELMCTQLDVIFYAKKPALPEFAKRAIDALREEKRSGISLSSASL